MNREATCNFNYYNACHFKVPTLVLRNWAILGNTSGKRIIVFLGR